MTIDLRVERRGRKGRECEFGEQRDARREEDETRGRGTNRLMRTVKGRVRKAAPSPPMTRLGSNIEESQQSAFRARSPTCNDDARSRLRSTHLSPPGVLGVSSVAGPEMELATEAVRATAHLMSSSRAITGASPNSRRGKNERGAREEVSSRARRIRRAQEHPTAPSGSFAII